MSTYEQREQSAVGAPHAEPYKQPGDRPPVSGESHVHEWKREYAPNYRQASEADDWREECACGAFRSGTDRPPVSGEPPTVPTRIQYAHGGGRFYRGNHLLADYFDRETGDLIERAFVAETTEQSIGPVTEDEHKAIREASTGAALDVDKRYTASEWADLFDAHCDSCMKNHRNPKAIRECFARLAEQEGDNT